MSIVIKPVGTTTITNNPGGSDTQVQVKSGSNFVGDANLTWVTGSQLLNVGQGAGIGDQGLHLAGGTPTQYMVSDGDGANPAINFGHLFGGSASDWTLSVNEEGDNAYDLTIREDTNSTYKIRLVKGTDGALHLCPSGGLTSTGPGGFLLEGIVFTSLSGSPSIGQMNQVTDCTVTSGNVTVGGSTHKNIVIWNGTNWKVLFNLT